MGRDKQNIKEIGANASSMEYSPLSLSLSLTHTHTHTHTHISEKGPSSLLVAVCGEGYNLDFER